MRISKFILISLLFQLQGWTQVKTDDSRFSLGVRSTFSAFSDDGQGLGTGGQFRIRFTDRVNSDWFGDYIVINQNNQIKSEYAHIGWSVLFYPWENTFGRIQPYILAGHCFDYNKKTLIAFPQQGADRWGSAIQSGFGTHFFLSSQMDVSLSAQYMIHLTKELISEQTATGTVITQAPGNAFEGHLLCTLSMNYRFKKR